MNARELRADIAVFLHGPGAGGAQRRTVTLVNGFVERGYEVDLIVVDPRGPLAASIDPRVRVVALTRVEDWSAFRRLPRRVQLFLAVPLLARRLRRHPASVLMSAASHVHLPLLLARRLSGSDVPVVLRLSNHFTRRRRDGSGASRRPVATFLARRLFPDAAAAIAVSGGVAEDIAAATGLEASRIVTIPNPIPAAELRRRATEPLAHAWMQPGEPPVVLGVGRVVRQKDFPTLVRAFAKVRARRPARLLVLGRADGGAVQKQLEGLVGELGLSRDVALAGYVDNPAAFMARAAVVALSSAWEGLPGVLIEAMACGCPVVSTDCPSGPSEILAGGRYGALVPVGDHEALAAAIERALDEPVDRAALVARADEYDVDRAVDAYLAVLLSKRRRIVVADPQGANGPSANPQALPALPAGRTRG